jgi:hypothetical protein
MNVSIAPSLVGMSSMSSIMARFLVVLGIEFDSYIATGCMTIQASGPCRDADLLVVWPD